MAKDKTKGKRGGGPARARPAASPRIRFRRAWLAPVSSASSRSRSTSARSGCRSTIGTITSTVPGCPAGPPDRGESLEDPHPEPFFANFHPLTTLTYAFDRAVWGAWTPGFHITQLVFYVGGVIGLYFFFARVLNWRAAAFVAAALYAIHPSTWNRWPGSRHAKTSFASFSTPRAPELFELQRRDEGSGGGSTRSR